MLTARHRRATEARKNSMVLLVCFFFYKRGYLTSLTTGQPFRKQCCELKQNSFQFGYLPPGRIWSSFLLNVIQCSPQTQKTKHEYIFLRHLSLAPSSNLEAFLLGLSVIKSNNSHHIQLGTYSPVILHRTDSPLICHQLLHCRASYIFLMWVRQHNPVRTVEKLTPKAAEACVF